MKTTFTPYFNDSELFLKWNQMGNPMLDIGIIITNSNEVIIIKTPSENKHEYLFEAADYSCIEIALFYRNSNHIFETVAKVNDFNEVLLQIGYGKNNDWSIINEDIKAHSNEYDVYDYICRIMGLSSIVDGKAPILKHYPRVSVIIPGYGIKNTLNNVIIKLKESFKYINHDDYEIIVIDDFNDEPLKCIEDNVQIVRTKKRVYSSQARNIGIEASNGEMIFFIDGDTYVSKNYISENLFRNMLLPNIVTTCMRENLYSDVIPERMPKITEDTRYKTVYTKDRIGSTRITTTMEVCALNETNNFYNFGFGRKIGPVDLAFMVKGNNLCVSREFALVKFPPNFIGYGPEDVTYSAKIIARGCKVIPVLSAGVYHRAHELRSGSREKRDQELISNIKKQLMCLEEETWRDWYYE